MKTSQLICFANQLTGFYIMAILVFNELESVKKTSNECSVLTVAKLELLKPHLCKIKDIKMAI